MTVPRVHEGYLEARRRQIMDAAVACFSREGFHRTTMQDIVAEAGLSAGSLYRYFDSKEEIVASIADDHHAPEGSVLAEVADTDDVIGVLRRLAEVSLGRLTDEDEQRWRRVTVQLWAEALRDPAIMTIVRKGLDGPVQILKDLIKRGQRKGTLRRGVDPEGMARVCSAIFQGLVLQQAWDPDIDVRAYIEACFALLESLAPEMP